MGRVDPHGSGWVGLRAGLGWRFDQPEPARVTKDLRVTKNPRARTKYSIYKDNSSNHKELLI